MVFSSQQINQMMSGQQAMFANHAAFAHNVGAQAGIGGQQYQSLAPVSMGQGAGGMGASLIGGMGQALPGAMAGASLAGGLGLLGHVGGYLDPFTGVGRAFMGGAGAAGGFSGGVGALGAGIRAAALPAMGYYAAFKGASYLGEQIYQGAQNIGQVGGMAQQYMGPQYGEAGARPGGQMSRAGIQNITTILHEIAGEETGKSMQDMMRTLDTAGRFGMLTGIQSADQFKQKFRTIVDRAKTIADVLGTTIEEAMPALSNFNRMGLWTSQDIMGASLAMKQVGPQGAGALQQTMMTGAQRSHAMGGSLAAGAALGRNQFLNISSAVRAGVLSDEMITEFTGGVGGVEGQQMLADRMTGALQSMTMTPMGRLSMAGLGEVGKDGEFTGRIDAAKMAKFQRGELSVGDLQRLGQKASSTRAGAASFTYKQEQIGQELMAQGGMDMANMMYQQVSSRGGFLGESDSVQGLLIQKMFGLNRRDSMMLQKLMKRMPEIQERRQRRELAVLQDAVTKAEERKNRSFEGLKDVMADAFEDSIDAPIQQFSEKMGTVLSEKYDRLKDMLTGRVRQSSISRQEEVRRLLSSSSGGRTSGMVQDMALFDQSSLQGTFGDTTTIQRMRNVGVFAGAASGALSAFGFESGVGTRAELLLSSGARTQEGFAGAGDIEVRGGPVGASTFISAAETRATSERIRMRGGQASRDRMFKKGQRIDNALAQLKSTYLAMTGDPKMMAELDEARATMSPAKYQDFVLQKLAQRPGTQGALTALREGSTRAGGSVGSAVLDALAVIQADTDYVKMGTEIDFGKIASESGAALEQVLMDGKLFSSEMDKRTGNILRRVEGGEYTSMGTGLLDQGGGFGTRDTGFSETSLRSFLESGPAGEELEQFLSGTGKNIRDYKNLAKASTDNPQLRQFLKSVGDMSDEERSQLSASMKKGGGVNALLNARSAAKRISARASASGEELGLLDSDAPEELRNILTVMAGANKGSMADRAAQYDMGMERMQKYAGSLVGNQKAIAALRRTGGATADHIADLAEIQGLDPSKMAGQSGGSILRKLMNKGLGDEVSTGLAALPEAEKRKLEAVLESKKVTKEQAEFLKKTLQKVEQRIGLEEGRTAREETQRRLNQSLTSFVGANEAFVLAVSAALPKLGDIKAEDITNRARQISQNNATREEVGG